MRVVGSLALISVAAALVGCASPGPTRSSKTPGKISSQNSRELQFDLEKGSPPANVKAFDAVSGEHFEGQYLGDAKAYLTGDKGGALTCTMKIAPANPHGTGRCEDNKGGAYQVQF